MLCGDMLLLGVDTFGCVLVCGGVEEWAAPTPSFLEARGYGFPCE
jgi:hypothetical protein